MDNIELKKYYLNTGLVNEFYEFFINDKPLSEILTEFCKLDKPLLDNWIGLLGPFPNKKAELNYIKRLLVEQISEQEFRDVFPNDLDKNFLDSGMENYREELADEEIMIYGCPACGDYDCGGYKIKIDQESDQTIWTFNDNGDSLQFHFDKNQYFDTFEIYRKRLLNELNSR